MRGGHDGLPAGSASRSLGAAAASRDGAGATDLALPVGRTARAGLRRLPGAAFRVTALVGGPGTTPARSRWPLALSR